MTKKYDNPEIEVVKYESEEVLINSKEQDPNQPIVLPPDLDEEP